MLKKILGCVGLIVMIGVKAIDCESFNEKFHLNKDCSILMSNPLFQSLTSVLQEDCGINALQKPSIKLMIAEHREASESNLLGMLQMGCPLMNDALQNIPGCQGRRINC